LQLSSCLSASVSGQTGRELQLIKKELQRRKSTA